MSFFYLSLDRGIISKNLLNLWDYFSFTITQLSAELDVLSLFRSILSFWLKIKSNRHLLHVHTQAKKRK